MRCCFPGVSVLWAEWGMPFPGLSHRIFLYGLPCALYFPLRRLDVSNRSTWDTSRWLGRASIPGDHLGDSRPCQENCCSSLRIWEYLFQQLILLYLLKCYELRDRMPQAVEPQTLIAACSVPYTADLIPGCNSNQDKKVPKSHSVVRLPGKIDIIQTIAMNSLII